ncbi:hypothetical protein NQ318_022242 [Aromia moschata]|uniref:PiggyBac transposable element-derived protein domain-containing protein n=1 Tax=Aromia moschata TaxID=1265417 RepID=A0AAV8X121_9CUCU|nr:hypothetical protein NQ318_022242 [Aromia moschata]
MAKRVLQQEELEVLAENFFDDSDEPEDIFPSSESDFSDIEIAQESISSESEQAYSSEDSEVSEKQDLDEEYYIDEKDAFLKIIDLWMIDNILKFTNMYIDQLKIQHEYSRERDCKDITRDELLAYFGLLYLIGIKKAHHSNVKEIFANDGTGIQIVRAAMSYKRFLFITRCLRFDDKATRDERRRTDKLAAIRQFYPFVENCKSSFNLSQYTTIDEMLHPFRGRCSFVQYIPSKPAKYGIKMFALCDAESFYTSNIEIYCGKQPEGPYAVSNTPTDIVKRLITPIANSGRNLTIGNWFTNIPLADELLDKKITVVGTLKKNKREIPPEFQPQKQRVVESSLFGFQKEKKLVSYVPRKNKSVILLSTLHDSDDIDPDSRKPQIILDYNATKGGVDTVDKMCAAYSVSRIIKRWPLVIFYSAMNIAGINAQILYKSARPTKTPERRRFFLKNLSLALMKEHMIARSQIKSLSLDVKAFFEGKLQLFRKKN